MRGSISQRLPVPSQRACPSLSCEFPSTVVVDELHTYYQLDCRAHGISANKLMGLAEYAAEFASLGYAVVVFDYRRWGSSGELILEGQLATMC